MADSGESQAVTEPKLYNIKEWLHENEKFFQPPICNKLMHKDGQLKVFFVGGPNVRKDYHIDEGEEFFYMVKGDMCLKIVERGAHKDVVIKEGQVFLLPACIPHSPQRFIDTIGLVIERERSKQELDGLRYFVEKDGKSTNEILYEKWFHCLDLGPQLAAIIKEFFETDEYKTGMPSKEVANSPVTIDISTSVKQPFSLKDWIIENNEKINKNGHLPLFGEGHQFKINVVGKGSHENSSENYEIFIWQLEGKSRITTSESNALHILNEGDTLLIPTNKTYMLQQSDGSICISIAQLKEFKT